MLLNSAWLEFLENELLENAWLEFYFPCSKSPNSSIDNLIRNEMFIIKDDVYRCNFYKRLMIKTKIDIRQTKNNSCLIN